ncbi:MAG: chorismate synthase [Clostridia bacterium]|nr:chorismate synthase [Clostridia bacterium]
MKNTFGTAVSLTLFGESHGAEIGCVIDGLAPGIPVSEERIAAALSRRRPSGAISTGRQEPDPFRIVSGVYNGKTSGTPLCILIPNTTQRSSDYAAFTRLRPGHADLTAFQKYHGYQDPRGGGHFSGRITAPLVAAGAIFTDALLKKGIAIGTRIRRIAGVQDRPFEDLEADLALLQSRPFPVLDEAAGEKMQEVILEAKKDGDSVGGVLETVVLGMPAGVGEPWFDSMESSLSRALFAVPAVKGVEFGDGFALSDMRGSEANDPICLDEKGTITTRTNRNGGINGGITNGAPLRFACAVKPTPTLLREQDSVDYATGETIRLSSGGRHDPCIVHRAAVVVESVTALVLADALAARFGTDWLAPEAEK